MTIVLKPPPDRMELSQNANSIYVLQNDGISGINATSFKLINIIQ
ncbi:MAG TPA: hypothetical protein VH500_23780 [Nitrososphaeraceae archaeon]